MGATPVFADIDAETLNLDPDDVARRVTPRTKASLPSTSSAGPMPIDGLPDGIPVIEDTAQAFGAPLGDARAGALRACRHVQLLPDEEPPGHRRRRPRRDERRRARRADPPAALPRLDATSRRSSSIGLQLAPRRAPGGGAAALPRAARRLERARARPPPSLRELGLGEACELPRGRARPRVPHVRRPQLAAGAHRGGAAPRGHRLRVVLRDAAAPAARLRLARLRARLASGDRARRARRTSPCRSGRESGPSTQKTVVECVLQAVQGKAAA